MSKTSSTSPETVALQIPPVPLTIEGYSVLHQMMRIRWAAWRRLDESEKTEVIAQASEWLSKLEQNSAGQSGAYSLLGHKGDLMLVHFRRSFDELNRTELQLTQLRLSDYLEPATSYLSIIELGLYESTIKAYKELAERGVEAHSNEWKLAIDETLDRQREAMKSRLFPDLPQHRYICFYPMDRRRGEQQNWYLLPIEERARQMNDHGLVGRRYAGEVKQIITGSIGFDDWEWGVDLFADDPIVFKRLIYEMRFDHVSAVYALFGTFYVGLRVAGKDLGRLLKGELQEK
jgi:peroxiredoxin